jgi:hypothetical protein
MPKRFRQPGREVIRTMSDDELRKALHNMRNGGHAFQSGRGRKSMEIWIEARDSGRSRLYGRPAEASGSNVAQPQASGSKVAQPEASGSKVAQPEASGF